MKDNIGNDNQAQSKEPSQEKTEGKKENQDRKEKDVQMEEKMERGKKSDTMDTELESQEKRDQKEDGKAPNPNDSIEISVAEHTKLMAEASLAKEYKDKYIRLFAEFDNARKRMEREKQEFTKYANEGIVLQFLDILDNLERSVRVAEKKHEDYEGFLKGVEMVMAQIYEMLKKNGVKPIEIKGKKFDPNFHEVLLQEETDQYEEGSILEVFQKGYMLEERVIRTAKVKLAKIPSKH